MPTKPTQPFGRFGEQLAKAFLEAKGYEIITTNWRCAYGEIDIVARHKQVIVFVEVRSRHAETTEISFASITPTKQSRMAKLAEAYLNTHDLDEVAWQIDVIGVAIPRSGQPIIEHAEDALGW